MTDFGKGFLYNLILFSKHFDNKQANTIGYFVLLMNQSKEDLALVLSDNPPPNKNYGKGIELAAFYWKEIRPIHDNSPEKTLSSMLETWANGASDHLYDIEVPERYKNTKIEKWTKELQALGLQMGHGFLHQKVWTIKHFYKLISLTEKIVFEVDKDLGLNPEKARWS